MSFQPVFNYYLLYDDSKHYSVTTALHSKLIIELLLNRTVLFSGMSNIWENAYIRVEQYCCATALYILSMLAHAYNIIIDRGVGSP